MKLLDAKQFFTSTTSPSESAIFLTNGSQMVVSIDGEAANFSVSILGQSALKPIDQWTELATISAKDFSVSTTMTSKGNYFVGIDGIGRIKAVINNTDGAINVSGKVGE
nr:MAG TPA: hypothetical protein [Caudoviricetes sp.]